MKEFNRTKLICAHGPDIHFEGCIVHEFTTQRKDGGKSRWTELRLWETTAGNWIAESVGASSRDGDIPLRDATVIERAPKRFAMSGDPAVAQVEMETMSEDAAIQRVMEAFGWTTAAKAFAREMGWDVIRRVE